MFSERGLKKQQRIAFLLKKVFFEKYVFNDTFCWNILITPYPCTGVQNIRQETAANNNDLYSAVIICDVPINSAPRALN